MITDVITQQNYLQSSCSYSSLPVGVKQPGCGHLLHDTIWFLSLAADMCKHLVWSLWCMDSPHQWLPPTLVPVLWRIDTTALLGPRVLAHVSALLAWQSIQNSLSFSLFSCSWLIFWLAVGVASTGVQAPPVDAAAAAAVPPPAVPEAISAPLAS